MRFDSIVNSILSDSNELIKEKLVLALKDKGIQANITHPVDTIDYGEIVDTIRSIISRKTPKSFDIKQRDPSKLILAHHHIIYNLMKYPLPSDEDPPQTWISLIEPTSFGLEHILSPSEHGYELRYNHGQKLNDIYLEKIKYFIATLFFRVDSLMTNMLLLNLNFWALEPAMISQDVDISSTYSILQYTSSLMLQIQQSSILYKAVKIMNLSIISINDVTTTDSQRFRVRFNYVLQNWEDSFANKEDLNACYKTMFILHNEQLIQNRFSGSNIDLRNENMALHRTMLKTKDNLTPKDMYWTFSESEKNCLTKPQGFVPIPHYSVGNLNAIPKGEKRKNDNSDDNHPPKRAKHIKNRKGNSTRGRK